MTQLANNAAVFMQQTTYPRVSEDIGLMYNTWNLHIKKNHPEMSDSIDLIKRTVANPAYVAASRPGPHQTHSGNLVFVSSEEHHRNSRLHVFVQSPERNPVVSTAIYSKRYHAEVIWNNPDNAIQSSYDENTDVLYLSIYGPVAAITEEGDDGLLLRYSMVDENPVGVTILDFRRAWSQHLSSLAKRVASFLHVSAEKTEKELALITSGKS